MNRRLRLFIAGIAGLALNLSGSVEKAHGRIQENHVLPLFFHNPQEKLFRNIIKWLVDNGFAFISTQELNKSIRRKEGLNKKMAWITFDDGWRDNIDNVIPAITELDIPATFFVSTYPVEKSGYFWWTAVNRYKKKLPPKYRNNTSEIWRQPWPEIKKIVEELIGDEKESQREAMTVEEVTGISKLPQVTIGCHGTHHLLGTSCSENELVKEILESKLSLESWIKKPVKYFSFPKGVYSEREKHSLKKHGYELAASSDNYLIAEDVDLYAVPRFGVLNEAYFSEAICHVLGIWQPFKNKFKLSHKIAG